jgi:methionyl-tRNA formyltransferase
MRLAFLGTSPFAVPALRALASRHDLVLAVSQPDRPVGRHAIVAPTPVKRAATDLGIPVFQPDRINREDAVAVLHDARPDALVVAAYGQLLRPSVFDLAPRGAINIHASILPSYRGAAPVNWAIVRGETTTGITTFRIDAGMDTGPMFLARPLAIGANETAEELELRLAGLGAEVILETLAGLESGTLAARPQPEGATLAPKLGRDDGRIDWTRPASDVRNLVRGMNPWPGAWTTLAGRRIKIHRAALTQIGVGALGAGSPGPREAGRLLVACGDRMLDIEEIQREGRPKTSGAEFLNGLLRDAVFA